MSRISVQIGFILICFFFMNDGFSATTEKYVVEAYRLNIRKCASTKCNVLGFVSKNDTVPIESIDGNWAKVVFSNGTTGYISAKHIKKAFLNKDVKLDVKVLQDDIDWIKISPWVWLKYSILPFLLGFLGLVIVSYSIFRKQIKTNL